MRKSLALTAMVVAAFAVVPSPATLFGIGSLAAAVSLMAGSGPAVAIRGASSAARRGGRQRACGHNRCAFSETRRGIASATPDCAAKRA